MSLLLPGQRSTSRPSWRPEVSSLLLPSGAAAHDKGLQQREDKMPLIAQLDGVYPAPTGTTLRIIGARYSKRLCCPFRGQLALLSSNSTPETTTAARSHGCTGQESKPIRAWACSRRHRPEMGAGSLSDPRAHSDIHHALVADNTGSSPRSRLLPFRDRSMWRCCNETYVVLLCDDL